MRDRAVVSIGCTTQLTIQETINAPCSCIKFRHNNCAHLAAQATYAYSSRAPHKHYGDLDNDLLAALLFASKYGTVGGLLLRDFFGDSFTSCEWLRGGETL